jgi:hypothetical protein
MLHKAKELNQKIARAKAKKGASLSPNKKGTSSRTEPRSSFYNPKKIIPNTLDRPFLYVEGRIEEISWVRQRIANSLPIYLP